MTIENPNWVVPVGTKIVAQVTIPQTSFGEGAVAVIVKSPPDNAQPYRVRFIDGTEAQLDRAAFAIHRHFQQPIENAAPADLHEHIIYRCVVGSRAYGLDEPGSDTDLRGIYLPPADLHWSLYGVPDQLENDATQECYWELQKFITLALKANPNILECLYTPMVESASPLAEELLDMRGMFLSKLVYQTYNGYVMSQFRKLQKDLENYGDIRWKHAMHLIRLLLSGIQVLESGTLAVQVDAHRESLLQIRRGEIPWEKVDEWRLELHRQFDAAFQNTPLPERPNYERANHFLIRARQSAI